MYTVVKATILKGTRTGTLPLYITSILQTLLSSMTVLRDSIHMGSMSPFSMIHLGLSLVRLERSRITVENRPGRKSTVFSHSTYQFSYKCRLRTTCSVEERFLVG